MRIREVEINRYRSMESLKLHCSDISTFVGANNSGKSNILKALNLFFDFSPNPIRTEDFYNFDITYPIIIGITFEISNKQEAILSKDWIYDNLVKVVKEIKYVKAEERCVVNYFIIHEIKRPKLEWLNPRKFKKRTITHWLKKVDKLISKGVSFSSYIKKDDPSVREWQQYIETFINENPDSIEYIDNNKEVIHLEDKIRFRRLKKLLPNFVYIPASNNDLDISIIGSLIENLHNSRISNDDEFILEYQSLSKKKPKVIEIFETHINNSFKNLYNIEAELSLKFPTINDLLRQTHLELKDNVKTSHKFKGDGIQRSVIFTIFNAYLEISKEQKEVKSNIICIDEPELFLHPQMQRSFKNLLRELSQNGTQIFYSTHSSLFLDIDYFDEIFIIKKNENQFQELKTLSMKTLLDDLINRGIRNPTERGVREDYFKVFNKSVTEGFFANKVIIVEGDSEIYSLPIYANLLGYDFDQNNVSIVSGGGKFSLDKILRIFGGFDIITYLIFDGDKSNSDSNVKSKTKEILKLYGYQLSDISSLTTMITDTFTVFEDFLENENRKEIVDYDKIINKCSQELGPTGKPIKNKYIAQHIKQIIIENNLRPEDVIPKTIQNLIGKIKNINAPYSIL